MKTGIDKANSSFQKDVNRLRKRCSEFQKSLKQRRIFQSQALNFIDQMLKEGKITKKDLKPYFKRKSNMVEVK
jgi:polyhydroxyalkanoate synthesis regulator phasin